MAVIPLVAVVYSHVTFGCSHVILHAVSAYHLALADCHVTSGETFVTTVAEFVDADHEVSDCLHVFQVSLHSQVIFGHTISGHMISGYVLFVGQVIAGHVISGDYHVTLGHVISAGDDYTASAIVRAHYHTTEPWEAHLQQSSHGTADTLDCLPCWRNLVPSS